MANENELILIPRLEKLIVDGTRLKSDLDSLSSDINSKGGLKLSVSIDTSKLGSQLQKQIDGVTGGGKNVKVDLALGLDGVKNEAIKLTSDLNKQIQSSIKPIGIDIKTSTNTGFVNNLEKIHAQTAKIVDEIKSKLKELNSIVIPSEGLNASTKSKEAFVKANYIDAGDPKFEQDKIRLHEQERNIIQTLIPLYAQLKNAKVNLDDIGFTKSQITALDGLENKLISVNGSLQRLGIDVSNISSKDNVIETSQKKIAAIENIGEVAEQTAESLTKLSKVSPENTESIKTDLVTAESKEFDGLTLSIETKNKVLREAIEAENEKFKISQQLAEQLGKEAKAATDVGNAYDDFEKKKVKAVSQIKIDSIELKVGKQEDVFKSLDVNALGFDKAERAMQSLKLALSDLRNSDGADKQRDKFNKLNALLRDTKELMTSIPKIKVDSVPNKDSIQNVERDIKVLQSRINSLKATSSSILGNSKIMSELNRIENALEHVGGDRTKLKQLQSDFQVLGNNINELGLRTKSFGDRVQETFSRLSAYMVNVVLFGTLTNMLGGTLRVIKDIDSAMTELKKVTNETDYVYTKFLEGVSVRAQKLGATISDVVTATADFARLGFDISDASSLADATVIYKNVGDGIRDISDASASIISTMKAFNIQAEDSMGIVDRFNEVGNNFAISSKGIGDAFLRSASSLAAANNTIDESIGLFVAANNVVQDPDVVGTAIKTISMRLRNTAGELEELGEDASFAAESITKLQTQLLNLTDGKINIMLDSETFKSTYDIMVELSQVWDTLSDKAQADITRLIAGVRQGNIVSALMSNMQEGIDATQVSMNSFGSAAKENEVYLDSIAGKTDKLNASLQTMANSFVDSGLVKFGIDFANMLVKIASFAGAVPAQIIAIATAMATLSAAKESITGQNFLGFFTDSIEKTKGLAPYGEALLKINEYNKIGFLSTDNLKTAIEGLNQTQMAHIAIQNKELFISEGLTKAKLVEKLEQIGLFEATATQTATQILNNQSKVVGIATTRGQTVANAGLLVSIKASIVALKTQAALWLTTPMGQATAVIVGIMAIAKATDYLNKAHERQSEKLKEASNVYEQITSELQTYENELKTLNEKIDELNNKDNLSITDQADLERLQLENKELETRIDLLKLEQEIKSAEQSKEAIKTGTSFLSEHVNGSQVGKEGRFVESEYTTTLEKYSELIERQTELNNKKEQGVKLTEDELNELNKIPAQLLDQLQILSPIGTEAQEIASRITGTDEASVKLKNTLLEIAETIVGLGKTPSEIKLINFDKIINKKQFTDIKKEMEDLALQGKLTADELNRPIYWGLIKQLEAVGVTVEDVIKQFTQMPTEIDHANKSIEMYNSLIDNINMLNNASKQQSISNEITASTYDMLSEKGEDWAKLVDIQGGKYVLLTKDVQSFIETLIKESVETAKTQGLTENFIETLLQLGKTSQSFSDILKTSSSQMSLINTASKEMSENGEISVSTLEKLADSGLDYQNYLDVSTGKIKLNTEALRNKINSDLASKIATSQHTIELNKNTIAANNNRIALINNEIVSLKLKSNSDAQIKALKEEVKQLSDKNENLINSNKLLTDNITNLSLTGMAINNVTDEYKDLNSELGTNADKLQKAREELITNGKLSSDSIEFLMSKYPELFELMDDNMALDKALASEQTKLNRERADEFAKSISKQTDSVDTFHTEYLDNSQTMVNDLETTYSDDFTNFEKYTNDKIETTEKAVSRLRSTWQMFFDSLPADMFPDVSDKSTDYSKITYTNPFWARGSGEKMAHPTPGYEKINSGYGYRTSPTTGKQQLHAGVDLNVPQGTPIVSVESGKVIAVYADAKYGDGSGYGGYGGIVAIDHGSGTSTLYAHTSSQLVKTGDTVAKGQKIALSGGTPGTRGAGDTTGAHLHFEVRVNGKAVNPDEYLTGKKPLVVGLETPTTQPKSMQTKSSSFESTDNPKIDAAIASASAKYSVDPNLIKAIIQQESSFRPNAVSKSGAQGLMQLMPGTAKHLGVEDPFNIEQNIEGGTKYLREMLDTFNGDVQLALAAYNAGPGNVKSAGGIPPSDETQKYVPKVLGYYQEFSSGSAPSTQPTQGQSAMSDYLFNTYETEDAEKLAEAADKKNQERIAERRKQRDAELEEWKLQLDEKLITEEEYNQKRAKTNEDYNAAEAELNNDYRKLKIEILKDNDRLYKESFDNQLKELKFMFDAGLISEEDYYTKLRQLNDEYFKDKEQYLDEYNKNELEAIKGLQKIQEQRLNYELSYAEETNDYDKQISIYRQFQENKHALANRYRELEYQENSVEIMELQEQWREFARKISELAVVKLTVKHDSFTGQAERALESLNTQLSMLAENNFDKKIELTNEKLKVQESLVEEDRKQLDRLYMALRSGAISADDFKSATDSATRSLQQNAIAAHESAKAVTQLQLDQRNAQVDATMDVVELVKNLIKQEAQDEIDALNKITDEYKRQKDILGDMEDDLKDRLKAEQDLAKQKKTALDDEWKLQKKIFDDALKALDKEIDKYKEIIDAKKKSLDLLKEERDYRQQHEEKTKAVTNIEDRLAEIANNDSLSAKAERLKLEEELAEKRLNIIRSSDVNPLLKGCAA